MFAWLNSAGRLLKNAATGLLYKCRCNPCREWDIRVVCYHSREDCNFCGTLEACSGDFTFGEGDDGCDTGVHIPNDYTVSNLVWSTWNASEDLNYRFRIIFNGEEIHESASISADAEEAVNISWSWDRKFDSADDRCNSVSMEIDIIIGGNVTETRKRSICFCRFELDFSPSLKNTFPVPSTMVECYNDTYHLIKILGPYHSKNEAQFVIDGGAYGGQPEPWDEAISNYVQKCMCRRTGCGPGEEGSYFTWPGSLNAEVDFDTVNGGFSLTRSCPWPLSLVFHIGTFYGDDLSIELQDTCDPENAVVLYTFTSGGDYSLSIPPCRTLRFWGRASGPGAISCWMENLSFTPESECTQGIEDAFAEVPANHDELVEFIAILKAACELDGGTWDAQNFRCIPAEE